MENVSKDMIYEYARQIHARVLTLDLYGDDGERKFFTAPLPNILQFLLNDPAYEIPEGEVSYNAEIGIANLDQCKKCLICQR